MATENQILLYQAEDGETRLEVLHQDETVWLSQRDMAELFQKTVPTINVHIRNVYDEGELQREATIRKSLIVQQEGERKVSREVEHYNLDMIISRRLSRQFIPWDAVPNLGDTEATRVYREGLRHGRRPPGMSE